MTISTCLSFLSLSFGPFPVDCLPSSSLVSKNGHGVIIQYEIKICYSKISSDYLNNEANHLPSEGYQSSHSSNCPAGNQCQKLD